MGFRPIAAGIAVAAAALLSACSTQNPAGVQSTVDTSPKDVAQQQIQAGQDKDGPSLHTGQSSSATAKKFAGKTLTVELTGYDTKLDMAEFKLVKYVRGGADNGHYEGLPEDPGTHRLPLTKSPQILSVISICSDFLTVDSAGHANKACTKDQLVRKLNDSAMPFAQIQVDSDDRIAKVTELYAP